MKAALVLGVALLAAPLGEYSPTITHPYLPLSAVTRTEFERAGQKFLLVRRVEEKTEKVAGVECLVLVEEEFVDGKIKEAARNYFAQKDGTVYYFGEDVDNYKAGKLDNHHGTWKVGKEAKEPFVYLPAELKKGDKFRPEDVKGVAEDEAEVLGVGEAVEVNGVKYADVLKLKLTVVLDKEVKTKYYARGVGLVREEEGGTNLDLKKLEKKP